MFSERAARCGLRCPRPAAYQSPREGVEIFHARRHPWNAPPSYRPARARSPQRQIRRRHRGASPRVLRQPCPRYLATGSRGIRPRHQPSAASWPTCWSRAVTMSSPRDEKSGPRAAKPEDRHQNIAAATAKQQGLAVMVRQGRRRHRYPLTSASLYEPACQRTWWWISLRCPWCGAVHLHRVRQEQDAPGCAALVRAPGVREGPHGLPRQGEREGSHVNPDWALMRASQRSPMTRPGGRTGRRQFGVPLADVRQAARILYRQRRIDMCAGYVVAVPSGAEGRPADDFSGRDVPCCARLRGGRLADVPTRPDDASCPGGKDCGPRHRFPARAGAWTLPPGRT